MQKGGQSEETLCVGMISAVRRRSSQVSFELTQQTKILFLKREVSFMANEKKTVREPSFILALVPIVAMIGFMLYCFRGHSETGYHDAHLRHDSRFRNDRGSSKA